MTSRRLLNEGDYRLIVERSPTMIRHSSADGNCDYVNDTWLAYTGRDLADELGDGWTRGVHPEDYARCVDLLRTHFEQRRAFEVEYRLRRHDGAFRYVLDREVPLYDDGGWFAGFTGTCFDRDDQRTAERAKSSFLSLITEELRGPLAAITGQVAYLSRTATREPPGEETVRHLGRQVDRLATLVEQLASAARLEKGATLVLEVSAFDLTKLVVDLVAAKTDALRARGISVVPGVGIESTLDRRPIEGDASRLAIALGHIVDNAIQFSRGGRVGIALSSSGRYHAVSVSDDGIGIPADELGAVRHAYVRGSNVSRRNYPGAGLGLTIAAEIVEAHHGRLQVDSKETGGTRVTMVLPKTAHPSGGSAALETP